MEQIEGRNPVLEALRAGNSIDKLLMAVGQRTGPMREIWRLARERGIVIQEVDRKKLDEISQSRAHQGVIALVPAYEYVDVDHMLAAARTKNEPPFLVILDELQDPHNLGSILRTAEATGVHGVIIPKRRSVGVTATVAKASAGAAAYIPVARVTNLANTVERLKEHGLWIIGADMDGKTSLFEADLRGPVALIIGSEGKGISRLLKEKCDFLVRMPMRGRVSSLNASVAGALLMYEVLRQRGAGGRG